MQCLKQQYLIVHVAAEYADGPDRAVTGRSLYSEVLNLPDQARDVIKLAATERPRHITRLLVCSLVAFPSGCLRHRLTWQEAIHASKITYPVYVRRPAPRAAAQPVRDLIPAPAAIKHRAPNAALSNIRFFRTEGLPDFGFKRSGSSDTVGDSRLCEKVLESVG
jgi:hypothetical protein